jgi:hypothetical protein
VTRSLLGCARVYASSSTLSTARRTLLAWVSKASGVELDIIEHAYPASLDELWEREDMGCVFMCGYPWAVRTDRPRLLAFPVPSPPRYGGRLLLSRFVAPSFDRLEVFLERQHEAEAAGYPRLA